MKQFKNIIAFFLLLFSSIIVAQTGTIKGKITTSDGQPAEFVTVGLKGTTKGTTTDSKGEYEIKNVKPGNYTLVTSYIGLKKTELPILVKAGETTNAPDIALNENAKTLKEVTISAQKTGRYGDTIPSSSLRINTPLIETPQNISVVTKQAMEDFGVNTISDMARMVSGVQKTYGLGTNDFSFAIRGFDASNNEFRDGIGFLGFHPNQQMDAFMIDKVEFVKGPAGFMIGNSEPGGVFNQVSKQADGNKVMNVEAAYGSFNLSRLGLDFGDKFTKTSKFSYRVVVGGNYTNANYQFYKSYYGYVMPSVRYTYKEGSFFQAQFTKMTGFTNCMGSGNFSFNGTNFLYPNNFNADDPNLSHGVYSKDNLLRLTHTHQFKNGWHWKTQFAYLYSTYKGDLMEVAGFSPNLDSLYRYYFTCDVINYSEAAQTFIDGKFNTGSKIKHSFLTGVDYLNSWQNLPPSGTYVGGNLPLSIQNPQYNLSPSDTAGNMSYSGQKDGVMTLGWYGQDHIKFYDKLILTVAGRYSYSESYNNYFVAGKTTTVYNTKFTPRLGLTYLLTKNMSVYALYDQSFIPQVGRLQDSSLAKPLTGSNKEIGYKAQLLNNRLFINASVWNIQKNNVLVQNPLTQYYEQIGQVTSKGFEISAVGNVTRNIVVNVNYAYIKATTTKDANPANVGYPNISGTPRNSINGMIIYKFNTGKLAGLSAGAGVQIWEGIYAGLPGYSTLPADVSKQAPGYAIFDANAAYNYKKFSIHLNVYNLLNKTYMPYDMWWTGAQGSTPGYFSFYNRSVPINFRLAVAYKF